MKRVGLFGGSFNPIHNGHVMIGRTMLEAMSLDEVWYMVTPQNPWKASRDLLDEGIRLELTRLALADDPHLVASDYEFHLSRPSYTWKTLQALKTDYPDYEFVLIIGGDNLARFDRWAHNEEIMRDYDIAVFPRSGCGLPEKNVSSRVHIINVPLVDVTSTMLREMLRKHEDVTGYVPERVVKEITERRLWQS